MKKTLSIFCLAFLVSASLFSQSDAYFTLFPSISPDAKTIVFSYNGDIWSVPATGGAAFRITALEGNETRPKISPDGKWVAFSSNIYGNDDVFLVPVQGGAISRLTFHEGFDHVDSWSWDSEQIYFTSDRYNIHSGYKISRKGGTPRRVFDDHYFNNSHNLAEHPVTGEVFFNESWESKRYAHRQGYKGPYNPNIKSFNSKTHEYKEYTSWEGKDFWHTIDRDGNVYYVSDEKNGIYNLAVLKDSSHVTLTDFNRPVKRPQVSADGTRVVFELDYQIYVYDVENGTVRKPAIAFQPYDLLGEQITFNTNGKISFFDVSPDGKKLAFVSRGELFISDISGKFIKQLPTTSGGRVMEVKWLADSRSVLYNQTVDGHLKLFHADISGTEKQLTFGLSDDRKLAMDSKLAKALYISGRDKLMEIDLVSHEIKTIAEDEFWGFYNTVPAYSPDDHQIIYTAIRNFERDVFIYERSTGKTINITQTGVSEFSPTFDYKGRCIYYASDRFKPSFPRGIWSNHIYRLPLAKFSAPFRSDELDNLFEDEGEDKSETKHFTIDQTGIQDRVQEFGPQLGHQYSPTTVKFNDQEVVLFGSNHDEDNFKLWATFRKPFSPDETKLIRGTKDIGEFTIRSAGEKYYILFNGTVHELDLANTKVEPIDLKQYFTLALRQEFDQIFHETWSNVVENFYDENINGANSDSLKKKYQLFLPYVSNRQDLRMLVNDMLGEINASHLGFASEGEEEKLHSKSHTMSPGIMFGDDDPYRVKRIIRNAASDKIDLDIRPGDLLIRVDKDSVNFESNRESYFKSPVFRDELVLGFLRDGKEFEVKIHPQSFESFREALYDEWEYENEQFVNKKSDDRIAYIHMKNMLSSSLNEFVLKMTSANYQKDGLILDLRYNRGGNVHDEVLNFLSQKEYFQWKYRNGKISPQPNFIPSSKPIVLLINEQSLSDGEVTAEGFKQLKLGKVIGTETYHWIIFTTSDQLVDGSSYRLPAWGCFTLDGQDLEKVGVKPDIHVPQAFDDRFKGSEFQLSRAIEEILQELK